MANLYENNFLTPFCPTHNISCPYYNTKKAKCKMYLIEKELPYKECDAFYDIEDDYNEDD